MVNLFICGAIYLAGVSLKTAEKAAANAVRFGGYHPNNIRIAPK